MCYVLIISLVKSGRGLWVVVCGVLLFCCNCCCCKDGFTQPQVVQAAKQDKLVEVLVDINAEVCQFGVKARFFAFARTVKFHIVFILVF